MMQLNRHHRIDWVNNKKPSNTIKYVKEKIQAKKAFHPINTWTGMS